MSLPTGHLPIPRVETGGDPYPNAPDSAFWLWPDWTGGDNLRDPGSEPFWTRPSARPQPKVPTAPARPLAYGVPQIAGSFVQTWNDDYRGDPIHYAGWAQRPVPDEIMDALREGEA